MLTLVRSWIERIDCAKSFATEITVMFSGSGSNEYSIVSVMNIRLMTLAPIRGAAHFESTPWLTAA